MEDSELYIFKMMYLLFKVLSNTHLLFVDPFKESNRKLELQIKNEVLRILHLTRYKTFKNL